MNKVQPITKMSEQAKPLIQSTHTQPFEITETQGIIEQWVEKVIAFSSEYSPG